MRWTVAALVVATPLVYAPGGYDPALYSKLFVVAVCAVALSLWWAVEGWRGRPGAGLPLLDIPALLTALFSGLAFLSSTNPCRGGLALSRVAVGLAIYFPVSRSVSKGDIGPWCRATAAVLAAVSVIGIAQYLGIGGGLIPSVGLPSSTFFYRNFAAMYLILALPLAAVPFVLAGRARAAAVWVVPPTLGTLLLIYTRTRGAWVGFACGLAVFAVAVAMRERRDPARLLRRLREPLARRKAGVAATAAVFLLLASQVPQASREAGEAPGVPAQKAAVLDAARSIVQGQGSGRLPVWRNSLAMLRDHPFAGVGLANWEVVYPAYAHGEQFRPGLAFLRPHNDYLWIAAELGLPGLAVHVWLLAAAVLLALRHVVRGCGRTRTLALLAAVVAIVAISGHAFFSFPRERPTPTVLTWAWLGLIAGLVRGGGNPSRWARRRAAATVPALLLAMVAGLAGVHVYRGYLADSAYCQGLVARNEGRWAEAAGHLDRAVSIGVFDYRYLLQKSGVLQHLGRTEEALAASQACLAYHPNSISGWYNVGQLRSILGDYAGAREALTRTVSLDPDNGVAYGKLGVVYRRLGVPDSARQAYAKALALAPNDAIVNYNAAGFYREAGETARARGLYERCVELDSTFVPGYHGLAEAAAAQGDYALAADVYRHAIRLDPDPPVAHYGLGTILERLGDRGGAVRAYEGFLERWRGDRAIADRVRGYIGQLEQGRD